ncbi:DNA-binding protein [Streptomyces albofaciens JCM 4342]|uniref:OB-fold nucleic acid binding domain-containing protein n=1 Tax=Streptomyces albofaciens TaxID=66866 RepID=UPI001238F0FD|nr:OB-fold nucleic acid binding domain-containing protein [Streptomyces albofaciens]KAA6223261.1 DNA-binding protein [Streptomyces albofaciens JCM 4342]
MPPISGTPEALSAPLVVEFPFTRSLGPVQSAFLTGLRERTVLGVRTTDGRVLVPPVEYDPVTAEEIRDLVEVGTTGTVTTWAWNPAPRRGQPLATPFAWVLVRLDGADTALLHALDAAGPDAVRTGMRVRVRWAGERTGAITDIACFEPYEGGAAAGETTPHSDEAGEQNPHSGETGAPARHSDSIREPAPHRGETREPAPHRGEAREPVPHSGEFADPVTGITAPARLDYTYAPGRAQSRYLAALAERRTVGERCPSCRKVYVPPRGACPTCGVATRDQVEVGPNGTVTTFCIVNIKAKNLDIEVPYVYAHIALDGADLALHARIGGIPYDEVRMGLRVEPVWRDGSRYPDHYRPTGEPDADYDSYKELI